MSWYDDFYAAVDAMDISAVERLCTPDTTVRFANHPPAQGRAEMRAALQHVWSSIAGLHHSITEVTEQGDRAVVEAIVDYTRPDGSVVSIPAATAIERRDGLIARQRIYIDTTPLQEGPAAAPLKKGSL
jgi:ketosteroid isomerase-like protein